MDTEPITIIDIITLRDGMTAKDVRGNVYKIESIMLGMGSHRKTIKWEKHFLKEGSDCRAEVLPNGKLNITQ